MSQTLDENMNLIRGTIERVEGRRLYKPGSHELEGLDSPEIVRELSGRGYILDYPLGAAQRGALVIMEDLGRVKTKNIRMRIKLPSPQKNTDWDVHYWVALPPAAKTETREESPYAGLPDIA